MWRGGLLEARYPNCWTTYLLVKKQTKKGPIKFGSLNLFPTRLLDKPLVTGEQAVSGGGRLTQRALPGRLQQLGGLLGDHGDP